MSLSVLRAAANGEITYTTKPSGQAEATFKLVRGTATEAVFENPEHKFPQRVIYTLPERRWLNSG